MGGLSPFLLFFCTRCLFVSRTMTDAVKFTYQALQVKKDIRNRESYIDTLQRSGGVYFDVIVYFLCQYVLA